MLRSYDFLEDKKNYYVVTELLEGGCVQRSTVFTRVFKETEAKYIVR